MEDSGYRITKYNENKMCMNCIHWVHKANLCTNIENMVKEALAIYTCHFYTRDPHLISGRYSTGETIPITGKKITQRELARELGIHESRVSLVILDRSGYEVSDKTRLKVLRYMKSRGFKHVNLEFLLLKYLNKIHDNK